MQLNRRQILTTTAAGLTLAGLNGVRVLAQSPTNLEIGIPSPIPSLDIMGTTDDVGRIINLHIYEALVTRGEDLQPKPGLAESWSVSDDGTVYTFVLRPGVTFHNGDTVTATDVKASIERFQRMALRRQYLNQISGVEVVDDRTVNVVLSGPQPLFLNYFSQPEVLVAIIPAADGPAEIGQTSFVGTGPYRLLENVGDGYVRLGRFDDYALDERYEGTDGYGGRKIAHFETLTFRIIPEPASMVAALEVNEIQLADIVPARRVAALRANPDLQVIERMPTGMMNLNANFAQAPLNELPFRRAIASALDMDEIMAAATDDFYRLNPYHQYPGYPTYPGHIPAPYYNVHDLDQARAYLAQSSYDGRELTILAASTFPWHSTAALVVSEHLRAIGVNSRIETMDWPAVVQRRGQNEGWDLNPGLFGTGPWLGDPVLSVGSLGTASSSNRAEDPELRGHVSRMQNEPTPEARLAAWFDAQQRILDELLVFKLGDIGENQAARSTLQGFAAFRTSRLWGVTLDA